MNVQPFDLPNIEGLLPSLLDSQASPKESAQVSPALLQNDVIRRMMPGIGSGFSAPSNSDGLGGGLFDRIAALLQQIGQLLAQMIPGGNALGSGNNGENFFQSANGASTGDPHLSFNGSTWNDMASQPDLLHSDSFDGGYQLSTQTTPTQNGVSYNQQATLTTNYAMTSVSLDRYGNASVMQDGAPIAIGVGQSIDLGNGEVVSRAQNSLTIASNNGLGGQITTTMTSNGTGVDVNAQGSNVDLGGTLVQNQGDPLPPRMPLPIQPPLPPAAHIPTLY